MKKNGQVMSQDIRWIINLQANPNTLFKIASFTTVGLVGLVSRFIIGNQSKVCLNKTKIYNKERLEELVENRPKNLPLLTISNHYSCFDDPAIFGCLKLRNVCSSKRNRWSMAAHDICFTKTWHSLFFMFGKCIPVFRGSGVYQPAVDLCIEKLKLGEWVHVFPEGKVNMEKEYMRLKWGVGRILYETYRDYPILPIIIPIWHIGMDALLPNYPPYYFRFNKKLTFNFGDPINLSELMKKIFEDKLDEVTARKIITDKLQEHLNILRIETEKLHEES